MSGLVSMALRMAVRYTLLNQTGAMARVIDSPIDPVTAILDQSDVEPRPLIAVYVQEVSGDPKGRELSSTEQKLEIVIWTYLTPAKTIVGDDIELEVRESGAAIALDIVGAQINRALRFSTSAWRPIIYEIAHSVEKVITRPVLVEIDGGVRIPASELIISCKTVPEPKFGAPLSGVWLAIDTAMRATAETAGIANLVKNLIEGPTGLPGWKVAMGESAFTVAEARAIGIAPLDATETGEPSLLDELTTSGSNDVTGPNTIPT